MICPRCGYSPSGKNRSNPQNKYYWGVIVQTLSDELGYTRNEIHDLIKYRFLSTPDIVKGRTGQVMLQRTKSTTELDTKSFESLMSEIREWASIELGIYLPEPNEILNDQTTKQNP